MSRTQFLVPALFSIVLGCATTDSTMLEPRIAAAETPQDEGKAEDPAKRLRDLERRIATARSQREIANLELEAFDDDHAVKLRHAAAEIDMARAALALFSEAAMPNRIAAEQLNLQSSEDRATEAREELEQIKIMYAEQDLDDLTAEFVVSRGERNNARAQARLEIQKAELEALRERELPQELARLELAVDKAEAARAQLEREGAIGRAGKVLALKESGDELSDLEEELAEAREETKS